jgi:glyoxylase-like metal-dependent hydrolase (beta-lactamase superfamily II)
MLEQVLPWAYVDLTLRPLAGLDVLELHGGERALTSEVGIIPTPGHMPGHTSILISSDGQQALIGGDVFASPAQVTNPDWTFGFDMDPAAAAQMRRRVLDRLEHERITLIGTHFPAPGHGRIARQGGELWWEPDPA